MATLEDQLAALKAARGSGELSVTFEGGRGVVYRSIDDLNKAIAAVQSEIDAAAPSRPARVIRTYIGRGT